MRALRWAACALLLCLSPALAAAQDASLAVHLLDYIAVDYGEAVSAGRVKNADEYKEMTEFAANVLDTIAKLPPAAGKDGITTDAKALAARIPAGRTRPRCPRSLDACARRWWPPTRSRSARGAHPTSRAARALRRALQRVPWRPGVGRRAGRQGPRSRAFQFPRPRAPGSAQRPRPLQHRHARGRGHVDAIVQGALRRRALGARVRGGELRRNARRAQARRSAVGGCGREGEVELAIRNRRPHRAGSEGCGRRRCARRARLPSRDPRHRRPAPLPDRFRARKAGREPGAACQRRRRRRHARRAHRVLEGFELVEASLGAMDPGLVRRVEAAMIEYRNALKSSAAEAGALAASRPRPARWNRARRSRGLALARRELHRELRHPAARGPGGHPGRGRANRAPARGPRATRWPTCTRAGSRPCARRTHVARGAARGRERCHARGDGGRDRAGRGRHAPLRRLLDARQVPRAAVAGLPHAARAMP